jgi:predicted Fe-Mo cluster-binding NifX family protein
MIVATPVTPNGRSAAAWGRARWIAVAEVADGAITSWQVVEVGWDVAHDAGSHGSHHARVVRFLTDHAVAAVVVDHVGEGMARMLATMGIPTLPASPGDARASVLAAVG